MTAWLVAAGVLLLWPLLLLALLPKFGAKAGLRFVGVQLLSWWATFAGWFLLVYPCLRHGWVADAESIADSLEPRATKISRWAWRWLNPVYGNPQEGCNGQEALVRDDSGQQGPYKPRPAWLPSWAWLTWLWDAWRAYAWAALRNSADGLKYLLAWDEGQLVTFSFFGSRRAGWLPMPQIKGTPRVPVLG